MKKKSLIVFHFSYFNIIFSVCMVETVICEPENKIGGFTNIYFTNRPLANTAVYYFAEVIIGGKYCYNMELHI